ncbi:UNVERIFIED_CONTAM: DNA-binding MarR family transcriptional regulator [Paenibacillus sp. PvR008]
MIWRGEEVVSVREQDQGVEVVSVRASGPHANVTVMTAAYVVGADGAGSTVRKQAGIAFPGTDTTLTSVLGDVEMDVLPKNGMGSKYTERGGVMVAPVSPGVYRVILATPNDGTKLYAYDSDSARWLYCMGYFLGTDGRAENHWGRYRELVWWRTDIHVIDCIGRHEPINVTTLADRIELSKGTVSKVSTKLLKEGWIRRTQLNDNKKEIYFRLTPLGKKLFLVHERLHVKVQHQLLQFLDRYSVVFLETLELHD